MPSWTVTLWLKYGPKITLWASIIAGVLGILLYARNTGRRDERLRNAERSVKLKEQYDEIAAHRPDRRAVIDSLRDGKF